MSTDRSSSATRSTCEEERLACAFIRKPKPNFAPNSRSCNGWGYEKRKEKLTYAIRGWVNYFRFAEMRNFLKETDEWLRSRIRMCIWKCWKRVRTRFKNLQRCGIAKWQASQWANTREGYWRTVHSPILTRAISNENLKRAHYPTLTEYYEKLHPR